MDERAQFVGVSAITIALIAVLIASRGPVAHPASTTRVNNLEITGGTTAMGTIQAQQALFLTGHIKVLGVAPILASCGIGAVVAGNATAGVVTVGSGAEICLIQFGGGGFPSPPSCTLYVENGGAPLSCSIMPTQILCPFPSNGIKIHYHCVEMP